MSIFSHNLSHSSSIGFTRRPSGTSGGPSAAASTTTTTNSTLPSEQPPVGAQKTIIRYDKNTMYEARLDFIGRLTPQKALKLHSSNVSGGRDGRRGSSSHRGSLTGDEQRVGSLFGANRGAEGRSSSQLGFGDVSDVLYSSFEVPESSTRASTSMSRTRPSLTTFVTPIDDKNKNVAPGVVGGNTNVFATRHASTPDDFLNGLMKDAGEGDQGAGMGGGETHAVSQQNNSADISHLLFKDRFVSPVIKSPHGGSVKEHNRQHQDREDTESVFSKLRVSREIATTNLDRQKMLEEQVRAKQRQHDNVVAQVFFPTCNVLMSLWNHFRVAKDEQRRFQDKYFYPVSRENYIIVSKEINKYGGRVTTVDEILRLVNFRETCLRALFVRCNDSRVLDSGVSRSVQENIILGIFNTILVLRHVSCLIVDAVYDQREREQTITGLMWEGRNYLIKMQDDLSSLQETYLAMLLPKFQFRSNPMLLPPIYFDSAGTPYALVNAGGAGNTSSSSSLRNSKDGKRGGPAVSAFARKFVYSIIAGGSDSNNTTNNSTSTAQQNDNKSSVSSSAKNEDGSTISSDIHTPARATIRRYRVGSRRGKRDQNTANTTSTTNESEEKGAEDDDEEKREEEQRGSPSKSDASATLAGVGNSRNKPPLPPTVAKNLPGLSDVTATSDCASLTSLPSAKKKMPTVIYTRPGEDLSQFYGEKAPSERQIYFQRKQKEEMLANTKVEMDRSNVYQYPPSIYLPKPVPYHEVIGRKLQNSLDPRITSKTSRYDEILEYERMQFGRISTPPQLIVPTTDILEDDKTDSYRTTVPLPPYTYADLHRREVLLFAETAVMKKEAMRSKRRRGFLKWRMAYRGFTARLLKNRTADARARQQQEERNNRAQSVTALVQASQAFLEWVREFAPDWIREVESCVDRESLLDAHLRGDDGFSSEEEEGILDG